MKFRNDKKTLHNRVVVDSSLVVVASIVYLVKSIGFIIFADLVGSI